MPTLKWFPHQDASQTSAVALVIHGLNYRPDRMQPVIDCLNRAGTDCLLLSLHGHGDNFLHSAGVGEQAARMASYQRVSYELWLEEVMAAYTLCRTRAEAYQVPLLLCGFSLGALMGCTAVANHTDVRFDRMILLAPALSLPPLGPLTRLAGKASRVIVPSIAPSYYQANWGTPVAAYRALHEAIGRLNQGDLQRLNVPALLFADKRDELISYRGVKRMAEQFPMWTFVTVQKSAPVAGHVFHHLIIGDAAVGEETWAQMTTRIADFVMK